jgi:hypothetical protein
MISKKHRVHLEVTYYVEIPVTAEDEEMSVIEIEKYIAKCDDYDIVNRSCKRQYQIEKVVRLYPERE